MFLFIFDCTCSMYNASNVDFTFMCSLCKMHPHVLSPKVHNGFQWNLVLEGPRLKVSRQI